MENYSSFLTTEIIQIFIVQLFRFLDIKYFFKNSKKDGNKLYWSQIFLILLKMLF